MAATARSSGMGAIPYEGGVRFHVWAPNAEAVSVAGTFNDWSEADSPLQPGDGGRWTGEVPGAKPGDTYRYLLRNGTRKLWRIDPWSRAVTNSAGNSIVPPMAPAPPAKETFVPPALNELVLYEMHVGTFNQGPGGEDGDFVDVTRRLGHLRELGVNAIEVMPVAEFAGSRSWGYNPCCSFAIESDYGGPAAFQAFVASAHQQGIAVIMDVVYNHLGPSDLGLWQFDGWSENGKGGIYFYNDWRAQTPWGDTRPDYGREEVRRYLLDNAIAWLEEYGVDGLRWDSTAFVRNVYGNNNDPEHDLADGWSLMQWVNDETHRRFPSRLMIAEDLRHNAALTAETSNGGAGFDAQWSAPFVRTVRNAIIGGNDDARDMGAVRDAIAQRYDRDAFERIVYTESHDEVANGKSRVPEEIHPGHADSWESMKRSCLGAALVLTAPGMPMLFQGQELLEDQWFREEDPVDWSRLTRFGGIVRLYHDLIHARLNRSGTTRGLCGQHVAVHHVNDRDKLLAYHRWDQGGARDDVLVVINMANRTHTDYGIGAPRAGTWQVRVNSDARAYAPEFTDVGAATVEARQEARDGMPAGLSLSIGPYAAVVLSQDE